MKKFTFIIAALIISSAVFAQTMLQSAAPGKTRLTEQVVLKGTKAPVATLTHSSDVMGANVGLGSASVINAAAQFPAATMTPYTGQIINKIVIGVDPSVLTGTVTVKIWSDINTEAGTVIASQDVAVTSLVAGWNEILLSTPYTITGSEIFVGYTCNSSTYGCYMDDQVPEANGYGDWTFLPGLTTAWDHVSNLGIEANWQIKAIVDDGSSFTDVAVLSLTAPNSTCEMGTEDFVATVKNNGSDAIATAFNLNFAINQDYANAVTMPVTVPMAAGATEQITLSLDMSADGIYMVEAYVSVPSDSDLTNDTAMNAAANTEPIVVGAEGYANNFDGQLDLLGVAVYDENADGSTWNFFYDVEPDIAAAYEYNSANAANDWLVLNCMDLEAGNYTLMFDYKVQSADYPEAVKAAYGLTADPSGMTNTIVDLTGITAETWTTSTTTFTVAAPGTYYVGFQAHSDADMYVLWLNNIVLNIETGINSNVASAISVFPNPANDVLNVANAENANITIVDMIGNVVATVDNASANQSINISNLANGTYFVRVNGEVFKFNVVK